MLSLLTFFLLNLEAKGVNLLLSSSKCILILLSINQSHINHIPIALNFMNISVWTNKTLITGIKKDDKWQPVKCYCKQDGSQKRAIGCAAVDRDRFINA